MNHLSRIAYATAIVIAALATASCDRRAPSGSSASSSASAPGGTSGSMSTAPSAPDSAASPASR